MEVLLGSYIKDYDLRHYIRVGDTITYESLKCCDDISGITRKGYADCKARVIAVYKDFVVTKLRAGKDCANRWNIKELNGKEFVLRKEEFYVETA